EFGRMPIAQVVEGSQSAGRDHDPKGFSLWMAGGGVKRGLVYGATDELGYEAVENPVSVTDWHATILHLLGLDYQRLVFDQSGFEEKLNSGLRARNLQGDPGLTSDELRFTLATPPEREWVAQLMASSDPWKTLGRSLADCKERCS